MMKLQNSSILLSVFLLSACATSQDYSIYIEAQKSLSRDATVAETARLAALTELAKSSDTEVKIQAIKAIQEIQRGKIPVTIEQPKKNWLSF